MKTSFKKIVVVMAVICVLFAMFALAASATEEVPLSGEFTSLEKDWRKVEREQGYKWNYNTETATLTIDGVDQNYAWFFSTLRNNADYSTFIGVYGEAVKTINITGSIGKMQGNVSVLGCPNVETFNSVCVQYQGADSFFGGLASLKTVNLGGTTSSDCVDITKIGSMSEFKKTFMNCSAITKVLLNQTTKFEGGALIPESMFEGCTSLSDIEIPGWVTEIKTKAFKNCTSLTRLTIPTSVTTIADDAFDGCTNIIIVCERDSYAWHYAVSKGIEHEEYDPSTPWAAVNTKDGQSDLVWSFNPGTGVLTVKSETTTVISYDLEQSWNKKPNQSAIPWFADYKSLITDIVIEGAITEISGYAFCDLTNLKTVTLPKTLGIIRTNAFVSDTKLESVTVVGNDHVKGVYDLSRINYGAAEVFQGVGKGLDIKIYMSPASTVTSLDVGVIAKEASSVTFYVLPGTTNETKADSFVAKSQDTSSDARYNRNISKTYYTWEQLKEVYPLASDAALSGDYGCGTWNFDIDTGVFEMVCVAGSGWRQWEFNGGSNPTLKTAWSTLKMYVKEMRFTGSVGTKIWSDGNFVFSNMSFLEKIAVPARVDQIQLLETNGLKGNTNLKTLGETDGVVDLTLFGIYPANLTNCTSIEKIKIGQSTSAMLEGLTGLSSVEFTGTDAENVAALGAAGALVFASDVRIDVKSAEVKAAVEALGYTNVHGPAATVKSGMILDGYQLRNADYNGLRTVYTFDLTNAKAGNPDYTLVEYGAILASSAAKNSYGTNLTQDAEGNWVTANAKVMKMAVGDSTGVINKTLDSSTNDKIKFCVAVVRYSNNYDTNLYNVGYEIWQNNETGEYSVAYTDYNTGRETTSSWAETSIYAVTLGRIKEGLEDPNNEIHWGVLTGKGAVTFTKGTDYTDEWTDMNGAAFGDTFTFLDVQAADNSGKTSGMSTFSVFEDENGKYVIIYKNGNTTYSSWDYGSQIRRSNFDTGSSASNRSWFVNNGKAPNPYIENAKLWEKIDAVVLAENVTVSQYAFNSTRATQLTYAPGTKGFGRAFTNANYLSSIFPTNYGGETSNKAEGVFDLSKTSGITDLSETFTSCSAAKYIRIPATVATINDKAFRSCGSLLSVVTGDNAFADGVIDLRDSAVRKITLGNSANVPIYGGTIKVNGVDTVIDNIRTVYLPALADGETFTIGAKTFNTAINFRQATFSQAVYDFVANSGVTGMTYTDINGNVWDTSSSENYESMAGWSNIIVD